MAREGKSLMRSLGQFFGHVAHAVKSEPARTSEKREVRREVEERETTGPDGEKVTLRRTTVEEIEIDRASERPRDGDSGRKDAP
jgi:hypothetical protein